jgi:hypothetical protein
MMDSWGLKVAMWKNGSLEKFAWEIRGEELQSQEVAMDTQEQLHEIMKVQKYLLEK